MSGKTKIEWLQGGKVWNPVTGCSKVSEGCRSYEPALGPVDFTPDQCQAAGVPFFFKQWGEWVEADDVHNSMVRVGKKTAGCLLDGRKWRETPL